MAPVKSQHLVLLRQRKNIVPACAAVVDRLAPPICLFRRIREGVAPKDDTNRHHFDNVDRDEVLCDRTSLRTRPENYCSRSPHNWIELRWGGVRWTQGHPVLRLYHTKVGKKVTRVRTRKKGEDRACLGDPSIKNSCPEIEFELRPLDPPQGRFRFVLPKKNLEKIEFDSGRPPLIAAQGIPPFIFRILIFNESETSSSPPRPDPDGISVRRRPMPVRNRAFAWDCAAAPAI
ncbi:hypothetical protein GEV33_012583 [Tenebrio molitor]|uniref:Uncharacterized protein n=1 Tax=Tenebrio molitor TaxID=7067 RepID=A0A8J6H8I8_TENMO|nr:hypothetical protein GEV33_012583 [Tenebrio molitor]